MSCGLPGQAWHANSAGNPNINREPPPPPYSSGPIPASSTIRQQTVIEEQHRAVYGPPVPIGVGIFPSALPAFGVMDPFMFGGSAGGALAPIRSGSFLPGAHFGIGFGQYAGGLPLPPPPPGAVASILPPFAPALPPWTAGGGGLVFGNVPATGAGGIVAGGFVAPLGATAPMQTRPAPAVHDGNLGFPAQPDQKDVTQIPGGIPAGVTLVESAENTIIYNIKGNVCPWLSPGAQFQVEGLAMSSGTGLNRLIQICNGQTADQCENMAVTECIELGNGLWEKGQTFKYNDAVSRVLTMKDAGWDKTRNRTNGQSLHLWGHRI